MSLEEVRLRARQTQSRVRRNLVVAFAFCILLLILGGLSIATMRSTTIRVLVGSIMAITAVIALRSYRRMWPRPPASNAAMKGCVTFYRDALQAQHRALELTWMFMVPATVFAFLTQEIVFRGIPFRSRIFLPVILLLILVERRLAARKIRRKLDALAAFENENASELPS
jgi:hypothetical protein